MTRLINGKCHEKDMNITTFKETYELKVVVVILDVTQQSEEQERVCNNTQW